VLDRLRRLLGGGEAPPPPPPVPEEPRLSFESWDALPHGSVVQVCHPRWRGVRTVTYAFGSPVVECDDLDHWGAGLVARMTAAKVRMVVIQGWPPGSESFARMLQEAGIRTRSVLHSSPAQHGAEPGEAAVADTVLGLAAGGVLEAVGMVKAGVAEAFAAVGHPVVHVPNRAPAFGRLEKLDLGPGRHVGVFAEPFWRKNVTTQLLAVGLIGDAVAHVMRRPPNRDLDSLRIEEHGELPWDEFVSLQGSVDLNLYVTLSECHPSTPQESYLAGVPCLMSRTSHVFKSDPELWELTTVDEADNPAAIAAAARRLLERKDEAIERAKAWISAHDAVAARIWDEFTA
jgi:hypothetical protein